MKIALMGDVMLGRLVNQALEEKAPDYPWGDTRELIKKSDLRICNLECVLADVGRPWSRTSKVFHFRSASKNVATLEAASIDMVSLANNHVLDFGYDALLSMLALLDRRKIAHAGAGPNRGEAAKEAVCEVAGVAIGLLAFSDNEPDWASGDVSPGIFYSPMTITDTRAHTVLEKVNEAAQRVDYLIVSAHWGPNWGYEPEAAQIPFAHALVNAGADLIFGHSGHICRGIEIYRNTPIIYCAGDFIDDYAVNGIERNDESFLFLVELEETRTKKIVLHPVCIENFQVNMARGDRAEAILKKMQLLCLEMGTRLDRIDDLGVITLR